LKILLLNQTFYPDVASTAQHLGEVALGLAEKGHAVSVVTGRRAYDNPAIVFPKTELWKGIRIHRVFSTCLGKGAKWRRAADFGSFILSCCARLVWLGKHDVVVALTTPPLISFIGAWLARIRGARFCYWVMDFNPDEAIAAGWLRADSVAGRTLDRMSRFSLRQANSIIALDRFMRQRIAAKGIATEKIEVIPPWSHDADVRFDAEGRSRFRKAHGLEDKFVVMYSGNHSPCHPLDTVMAAAKSLADNEEIAFCFVGGGSELPRIRAFAEQHRLKNITCLGYQPLDQLAGSLSAADLHLVVMGNPFVGLVHPCKIYNILRVGSPLLYVGPKPSHLSDILDGSGDGFWRHVQHGDADKFVEAVLDLKRTNKNHDRARVFPMAERFSSEMLLPRLLTVVESSGVGAGSVVSSTGARGLKPEAIVRTEPRA
jgi:hypothetical protein